MKTTTKIATYAGFLGFTVLVAILLSVREQLVTIGPWILDTLLAAMGLCLVYGVFRVYLSARKHWLAVETQRNEEKRIHERHNLEMLALQADIHVKLSRVLPDARGHYPVILPARFDLLPSQLAGQVLMLPPAQQTGQWKQAFPAFSEPSGDVHTDLPTSVRYEDIQGQIPRGHSVLGVSAHGLETCDFKDLMTMLISGGSSTGKSNTVAIKLHEAMQIGRNTGLVVIDPHKTKPDSLYNKIRQYEPRFLCPVASKDEDIIAVLRWFKDEFERRMELSTSELAALDDILLVCDEVYALCFHREDDTLKKLIKLVSGIAGYESRGYGMYAWFLTQKVTGLKWLRDAVMTTICHKMQTMSERILASNDDRGVARDMDTWAKGRVVVFGLNLPVTVAQMPLFVPPAQIIDSSIEPLQSRQPTTGQLHYQAEKDAFSAFFEREKADEGADSDLPENAVNGLTERSDWQTEDRLKLAKEYRFTEAEALQFIAAYRAAGNVEKVLASMRKGSGYKKHARELIQAFNLREQ